MLKEPSLIHTVFSPEQVNFLEQIELLRLDASNRNTKEKKANLGQFFTPASIARFMASMLKMPSTTLHILDAGAGVGSLFAACIAEACTRETRPEHIRITAYEIDTELIGHLRQALSLCQVACEKAGIAFAGEVIQRDFIEASVEMLQETLFTPQHARPALTV